MARFSCLLACGFMASSLGYGVALAGPTQPDCREATKAEIARVLEIVRADDPDLAPWFAEEFTWAHRCASQVTLFIGDDRRDSYNDNLLGADLETGGWAFAARYIPAQPLPPP